MGYLTQYCAIKSLVNVTCDKASSLSEKSDEVPVVASLAEIWQADTGEWHYNIITTKSNAIQATNNPTAHAEMLVLQTLANLPRSCRDCDSSSGRQLVIATNLEPCPMCAGAIYHFRIPIVAFDLWDEKLGGCGSKWDILRQSGAKVAIYGNVLEGKSLGILQRFFANLR